MGIKQAADVRAPLRPRLLCLTPETGEMKGLDYEGPTEECPAPHLAQEFTAGCWVDDLFVQPTHTELLWITKDFEIVRRFSHPLFHGVHSVSPLAPGRLVLTAAGIDSLLIVDVQAKSVQRVSLSELVLPKVDLRTLSYEYFKPHSVHPNFASVIGQEMWVSCFETRRLLRLNTKSFEVVGEVPHPWGIPHDGKLMEGLVWVTQTDGFVRAFNTHGVVVETYNMAEIDSGIGMLGWCRGVYVEGERLFVGFTMIRRPRHREVLRWFVRGESGAKRPTRVVEVCRRTKRRVGSWTVGNAAGGTIYGLTTPA